MPLESLLILSAAFTAGCIDAIVGGGGLIQTPALFSIYPDAAPAALLGTNKFSSVFGTANAAWRYSRSVVIPWRALLPLALLVLITAALGAVVATRVPPEIFRPLVPVLLLGVLSYVLSNKQLGGEHRPRVFAREHHVWTAVLIGAIGFYDGFFGPGTGSFLVFLFVRVFGFDFLGASAVAKIVNVACNFAGLLWFGYAGHLIWQLGLTMAVCQIAGSLIGSRLAMKHGSGFVRKLFLVVVCVLIVKTGHDAWLRW